MSRELWAKLHVELLDDGKLYERSDSDFRLWVSLILLAKMTTEDGVIRGMGADSLRKRFNLRCSALKVQGALEHFAQHHMLTMEPDGAIKLLNYEKRQAVKDYKEQNAERQRRWRDRNVTDNVIPNVTSNGDVTTDQIRREKKRRDPPLTPPKSGGRGGRKSPGPPAPKSPEQIDAEDRAAVEAAMDGKHG